jgi:protein-tyrosine phosphatase
MVDLHHHLLPGLDDGSTDLPTSIAMARMAAEDGITRVVATPHASHRYPFEPEKVAAGMATLRSALSDAGIPLLIGSGCDFHLSYDNIQDAKAHPRKYTLNASEYLLVELPDLIIPPKLTELFYDLRMAAIVPILTHPERNAALQRDTKPLEEWLRHGLLVQITTSSVLGQMGRTAEKMAHALLANRWVHFMSTDAHNLTSRPPRMRAARELVADRYGAEYAALLCQSNPLAVFDGQPLPPQQEPLHLFDEPNRGTLPWWERLFG